MRPFSLTGDIMKKVLMIASESSHFRNFHIPYIERLLKNGTQVWTAANGVFEHGGVVHKTLKFRKKITSPANIGVIFALRSLIRRERFDAVYTNSTLAGIAGRMAVKLAGVKSAKCRHICHGYLFNDDGSKKSRVYLMFEKLVRKRTELLAVMNRDDLEIARKYVLGRDIVFINGMGLDANKFPELSDDEIAREREELGAKDGDVLFLCVGEFSGRKNQTAILEACAKLRRTDYKMIFAGEGALLDECRTKAKELGLEDHTVFLGHTPKVNLLYRTCDCLISASSFEGLPFNVMEALYCGEDIIVSDVKGNRDLAQRSEVYDYGDTDRLAELMEGAEPTGRAGSLPGKYLLENVLDENFGLLKYGES